MTGMAMNGGRALVLGGGGVAGIAWEAGLITGLARAGVELAAADLIVGTSAGSVVGSFLAHGADVARAVDRLSERGDHPPTAPAGIDMSAVLAMFAILFDATLDSQEARVQVGAMALEAPTGQTSATLEEIGRRLPSRQWPDRPLLVTGVDAVDGSFVVWDRHSGAPLPLAVAASCSVPCVFPPVEIGGRRYMDGGTRSGTNADLAKGSDAVVILEPLAHVWPREMLKWELAELGEAAAIAVGPDQAAIEVFGMDVLSPKLWGPAYQAGLAQAPAAADAIASVWECGA